MRDFWLWDAKCPGRYKRISMVRIPSVITNQGEEVMRGETKGYLRSVEKTPQTLFWSMA